MFTAVTPSMIYSEMDLLTSDSELRTRVANELLSKKRVAKKIKEFNGYVGYLKKEVKSKYYDSKFEKKLGIYRSI